ncbi:zinc finger protein GAI-ASSOCIATED FACTOR 1-like isoform X2 [Mangifera indica]|uniref:zinc finger protein GAI-ASSOCIATED FACTOR 1-like isoform X2 n=1 Tax=Mangifera indica TaxID=29780 RepID=UPI001CFB54A5|nr:zinc finger protein GAI-ASSOCIATED FACTOR 1-like isoform X2 [Mangifera indica]
MTAPAEDSISSSVNQIQMIPLPESQEQQQQLKKKRNLPGMPDPDSIVIALSPKTLLATNRFLCEICNKGFQRDQNLQLHRRGHNLPWKLKQRTIKENRKKVYVCPEPTCVHHDPARALGDLTGIKKHYSRKHGEKKYKCEKCSKKYAVQSDWKAHMKTCGTREYKCDCGTVFSRRDSFITHRAFCDALAEECAKIKPTVVASEEEEENHNAKTLVASPPPPPHTPSTSVVSPEMPENPISLSPPRPVATTPSSSSSHSTSVFASVFSSSLVSQTSQAPSSSFSNQISSLPHSDCPSASGVEPTSLSLSPSLYLSNNSCSLFSKPEHTHLRYAQSSQPAMSATALLQKAAQMGATSSNQSLLRGFGLSMSPSSTGKDGHGRQENNSAVTGLGLGLSSGLTDVVMDPSSLFGSKPATLDLLGLGIGAGGASTSGLSALLNSFGGGGFNVGAATASYGGGRGSSPGEPWEGATERMPHRPALP